mmetsp:Transcript_60799/g.144718  ORF Transcript_60799/g.144718 Transcript_60799/m.144718 type:complete len:246 (-) Transcript_60799:36-773(-)
MNTLRYSSDESCPSKFASASLNSVRCCSSSSASRPFLLSCSAWAFPERACSNSSKVSVWSPSRLPLAKKAVICDLSYPYLLKPSKNSSWVSTPSLSPSDMSNDILTLASCATSRILPACAAFSLPCETSDDHSLKQIPPFASWSTPLKDSAMCSSYPSILPSSPTLERVALSIFVYSSMDRSPLPSESACVNAWASSGDGASSMPGTLPSLAPTGAARTSSTRRADLASADETDTILGFSIPFRL